MTGTQTHSSMALSQMSVNNMPNHNLKGTDLVKEKWGGWGVGGKNIKYREIMEIFF